MKEKRQRNPVVFSLFLLLAFLLLAGGSVHAEGTSKVYAVPTGIIDYEEEYSDIQQYASAGQNGVYHLQENVLYFCDGATGSWRTAYTFPEPRTDVNFDKTYYGGTYYDSYIKDGLLYVLYNEFRYAFSEDAVMHVAVYDLERGKFVRDISIPGHIGNKIGVDCQNRIYIYVRDYFKTQVGQYGIYVYDQSGQQLTFTEYYPEYSYWGYTVHSRIFEFNGFLEDGTFFYTRSDNWVYWGYDHDMQTLAKGKFANGRLVLEENYLYYMRQIGWTAYQNCAEVWDGKYLADVNGSIYTVSEILKDTITDSLSIPREQPETSDEKDWDFTGLGVKAFYDESAQEIYAYTSGGNILVYDFTTKQKRKKFTAQHEVFSLLEMGDKVAAIEKENGKYYVEIIPKASFRVLEKKTINLNVTDPYKNHTEETVIKQWLNAVIDEDTEVYKIEPSTEAPYREGVYTREMQEGLLKYSNYLRWLGGLTPLTWADETTAANAGKAAVVLTASGQLSHTPEKTSAISDMSDSFFEAGYQGASDSNLSQSYLTSPEDFMEAMEGFLTDTENVGAYECGHRFTFLQRGATQIAYGSAERNMAQTVVSDSNDTNESGTVRGADNNDYAYTWPGAGAFPEDVTNVRALWSINLNTDKVGLSSEPVEVVIKDLNTGREYDQTSSLSTSRYLGTSAYADWFYGACLMFDPPTTSSYEGKNYQVTIKNLETPEGDPVEIVYTVQFISHDGTHVLDGKEVNLSKNGKKLPKEGKVYTVDGMKYKVLDADPESGSVQLTAPASKKLTKAVIPDTVVIEGITYPVTSIADKAFQNCTKLKKVTIGENVEKIGKSAFSGDKKLKDVTLLSTKLSEVGKNALKGVPSSVVLKIPESKVYIYSYLLSSSTGLTKKATWKSFSDKKWTVTFKNGKKTVKTQEVRDGQAASAPSLTKEGYILSWNVSFKKVTKNLTVKAVWTPELPKKGYTKTIDGIKYKVTKSAKKNGTVQVTGVSSKNLKKYTIPSTVKIGKYRFQVTGIGSKAFRNCKKAASIVLPKTITSVGKNAFKGISKKAVVSVPKAGYKKISKLLWKAGLSKNIKIKKR